MKKTFLLFAMFSLIFAFSKPNEDDEIGKLERQIRFVIKSFKTVHSSFINLNANFIFCLKTWSQNFYAAEILRLWEHDFKLGFVFFFFEFLSTEIMQPFLINDNEIIG